MNVIGRYRFLFRRNLSSKERDYRLKRSYEILNLKEDSDQEAVRRAYLKLAKEYHPDSGSPKADIKKFQEIEAAFRSITRNKSKERHGTEEEPIIREYDIKHTAPQHRQYLSYEGSGFGTPSQREKMWAKKRASTAAQNVMEHRISKAAAGEHALMDKNAPKKLKHDVKTQLGFDRLVEDLIQEAMSKGEFDNLPGTGKPLSSHQNTNPYVDFVTHKMNQVLIDNGFTPAWITLQKEITRDVALLRSDLLMERSNFGPFPLSSTEEDLWVESIEKYKTFTKQINAKITHFNLVVPVLQKQMIFISLEKEAAVALKNGKDSSQCTNEVKKSNLVSENNDNNDFDIFTIIKSAFKS